MGGAQSKLAKIKVVRKSIARVLTVYNQKMKEAVSPATPCQRLIKNDRIFCFPQTRQASSKEGTFLNKDLRVKKTRAIRRRLTPDQAAQETKKAMKARTNFPMRKYAVKA